MENLNSKYKNRQSGIELLKIIAIFLIVVSHVSQSLYVDGTNFIGANDYYIDLSLPTLSPVILILSLGRYAGTLGNTLFIGCTCWFLCGQKKFKITKILLMYLNTYIFSMIFLLIFSLSLGYSNLDKGLVFHSFLPIYFKNNWYITYYLIFCLVYPLINIIAEKVGKIPHLIIAIALFTYSFVIAFSFKEIGSDKLVTWIAEYLVISYIKTYKSEWLNCKKANLILLISSFVLGLALVITYNFVGLNNPNLNINILRFNSNYNPFTFIFAFCVINLFSKFNFSNKFINYISSLSLFVYLIHENQFVRRYFRIFVWEKIYQVFGFSHLFMWFLIYSCLLFICSIIIAFVYDKTINSLLKYSVEKISHLFKKTS